MSVTDKTWMEAIRNIFATQQTATALTKLPPSELTDVQLFQLVQALLAGQAPEAVLVQHPALRENAQALIEIETLLHMFQGDDATPMIEPSSAPRYRLDFIQQPAPAPNATPAVELWNKGHRWIQDQMGVLWIDLAAMVGSASMQPVLVTRSRQEKAEKTESDLLHQLSIGSEELDDLDLEVKAVRTADPDYCTLIVTARIPSRWPELGGVEVIVLSRESRRTGHTDEEGQVVFEQFPLKELEQIGFQISPIA